RNGEKITNQLPVNFIGKLVDNYSKRRGNLVQYRVPFMVSRFSDDSVNKSSGILTKDILVEIDSIPIRYFDEVSSILAARKNKVVLVKVKRDKEFLEYSLMVNEDGKFGIYPTDLELNTLEKLGYYNLEKINYSFTEAIPAGFNASYDKLVSYIDQMKLILTPETEAYKGVGGFISIANIFPPEWDWYLFWNMTALLSIILGFMNLLPIPALDGGHVMFTLWEMVTGRKPSDKFLEYAQITGFILLIALLLFANGNDVLRLFQ
ncbi:MAG: site-2 protease family protein, partial [Flavobacteriaceae bacterium]|nr:site-2 protease family protein [Flavobacteriaceae bacterium]